MVEFDSPPSSVQMLLPPSHSHLLREGMSCTACYYFLLKWKDMLFIKHTHFSTPKGQNWAFWLSTFPDVKFQIRHQPRTTFFMGHLFTSLPFLFAANKLHKKQFWLSEDSVLERLQQVLNGLWLLSVSWYRKIQLRQKRKEKQINKQINLFPKLLDSLIKEQVKRDQPPELKIFLSNWSKVSNLKFWIIMLMPQAFLWCWKSYSIRLPMLCCLAI